MLPRQIRLPRFFRLCLLAVVAVLAGCARSDDAPRLTVLTPGGEIRRAVDRAVGRFRAENPGVAVDVVSTPSKNYYVKSLTMLAGKAGVDLLWMGQGFGMFAERGALLDLGPFLRADGPPGPVRAPVQEWYRFGGAVYGIPYGVDVQALGYNRDLFARASLPVPDATWTVDDLLDAARRLTRRPGETAAGRGVAGLGFRELPLLYSGLTLLDPSAEHFALNTPAGLAWLRLNDDLIWRERILQRGSDQESVDRLTGFLNGNVAMIDVMTWDIAELGRHALFKWGIAPAPLPPGPGVRRAWASSSGFSIATHCPHPDLAWKLLRHLTDETFQRDLLDRLIPVSPSLLPAYIDWHARRGVDVRPLVAMLDCMQPVPRIRALNEVEAEWEHWKELALIRKISPEEALRQAELNINRILAFHREESAR